MNEMRNRSPTSRPSPWLIVGNHFHPHSSGGRAGAPGCLSKPWWHPGVVRLGMPVLENSFTTVFLMKESCGHESMGIHWAKTKKQSHIQELIVESTRFSWPYIIKIRSLILIFLPMPMFSIRSLDLPNWLNVKWFAYGCKFVQERKTFN